MAEHTKGPWRVYREGSVVRILDSKNYDVIAENGFDESDFFEDEQHANAKRIAACVNACEGLSDVSVVPELVEALEAVELFIRDQFATDQYQDVGEWLDPDARGIHERICSVLFRVKARGEAS